MYTDKTLDVYKRQDSVTEYSESLTRSSNRLGETKYRMVSVSHKGYAIFSGGYYEDADDHSGALESADMFDPNSTRIALPTLPRTTVDGAGAGIGNYAIVMNGYGLSLIHIYLQCILA